MGARWGRLFKEEGLLVLVVGLGNVANFVFHVYMSRALGPGGYGVLSALLGLLFVLSIPTMTVQASLAQFIATRAAVDDLAGARAVFLGGVTRVAVLAAAGAAAVMLAAARLQAYLHLPDTSLITVLALLVALTVLGPAFWAALQGLRRFGGLGAALCGGMLLKCGLGIGFVLAGGRVMGGMWGLILGALGAILIAEVFLVRAWRHVAVARDPIDFGALYRYAGPVMLGFLALAPFANFDAFLVRHYLPAGPAGHYASAMILGKAFLFLPSGIVLALFPNVAHAAARREDTRAFLWPALGLGAVLSLAGAVVCFAAPGLLARVLVRATDPTIVQLVRWVGFAITPVGLAMILVQYHMARRHWACLPGMLGAALAFVVAVGWWHASAVQVLALETGAGLALFAAALVPVWRPGPAAAGP